MKNTFLNLFISATIVAACQAESYKLKLERPAKVGDKAEITATGLNQVSQKVTAGGAAVANEEGTCESGSLDASREVLAVTEKGKPTKLKFTVKSLKYSDDKEAEPEEILADGKVVTVELKGKEVTYTVNGEPADGELAKALKLVIEMSPEDKGVTPDAILNTKEPHAVGDEWNADLEAIVKSMAEGMPFEFDPKASTGKVKLERIDKVNGVDCAILSAAITLVPTGMKGLPEGSKIDDSAFKMTIAAPVPVDSAAPEMGGKMQMNMAIKVDIHTPDGDVKLDMTGKISHEEKITPAK